MHTSLRLATAAGTLAAAALAHAAPPKVLFSNIASSPTSDVPGTALKFKNSGSGGSGDFARLFTSGNASRYVFTAVAVGDLDVLVTGFGDTAVGAVTRVKEGDPTPAGGTYSFIRDIVGISDDGSYAFSADTTLASGVDEILVRATDAGASELVAQEGTAAVGQAPGVGFGSVINSVHIDDNNFVRFRTTGLTGSTTQQVLYTYFGSGSFNIVAQTDNAAYTPGGQLVGPAQTIDNFASDRFVSDASGNYYAWVGDLNGDPTTDLVMVLNGSVIAQEGFPLPGTTSPNVLGFVGDAGSQQITAGFFVYRGTFNDGTGAANQTDFVRVDNFFASTTTELGQTGDPVPGAPGEFWSDDAPNGFGTTFFLNDVNITGDTILGGTTSGPAASNGVVVFRDQFQTFVVLREGDGVDVDGNGIADDDAFINTFGNDDAVLTDTDNLFVVVTLRNGAGTAFAQAIITLPIEAPAECGTPDFDGDGDEGTDADIEAFFIVIGGGDCPTGTCASIDFDNDGDEGTDADIEAFFRVIAGGPC